MSEEFGNNFVVLTLDDGTTEEFEHIDTVEENGQIYMAFTPAHPAVEDEADVVILKVIEENGEEIFTTIDDEAEEDRIYDIVLPRLEGMYEYDE